MNTTGSSISTGGSTAQSLKAEAGDIKDKAVDRLASEADSRKDQVAGGMKQVSSALDAAKSELEGVETPDWLKQGFAKVASSINSLASELESSDSRELTSKVQQFARQRPGTFLGACAAAGFAAARVFMAGKSDSDSSSTDYTSQRFGGSTAGMNTRTTSTTGLPYGQDSSYSDADMGHASPATVRPATTGTTGTLGVTS